MFTKPNLQRTLEAIPGTDEGIHIANRLQDEKYESINDPKYKP